jgi:hypothetical protein
MLEGEVAILTGSFGAASQGCEPAVFSPMAAKRGAAISSGKALPLARTEGDDQQLRLPWPFSQVPCVWKAIQC